MAYNEQLNDRIREALAGYKQVEEKYMFGGCCFMLNDKMCIGVVGDEMMCRIGPDAYEEALTMPGCREMIFTGRPMNGYVYVSEEGYKTNKQFLHWIDLCVQFNAVAKASKKRSKPASGKGSK